MSCQEQQEEEIEVLQSIYDGDEAFIQVSNTCFQYKIGEDDTLKAFLLEISWGAEYPESLPAISLDAFYNKHICDSVKVSVVQKLQEEAEANIGCAMTYTLFEYAKENAEELMADQKEAQVQDTHSQVEEKTQNTAKPKVKKEQLTKAQKRKIINRQDQHGEFPRGYDWIDVIKHLSQTGKADEKS